MPMSEYIRGIRHKIGNDLLLLPSVTGVVWDKNKKLLLVRQGNASKWTLPGGIVDPGESPAQTLVREIWEESGIIARPTRVVAIFGGPEGFRRTYSNGHQVEYVDTVFECEVVSGEPRCVDGETVEARFFQLEEIENLPSHYPVALSKIAVRGNAPAFCWDEKWLVCLEV